MAHYAYKCFVQDIDYEKYKQLVVEFEKEQGREHDGDSNYDGDNWIIAEMWVNELREQLAAAQAESEKLKAAIDAIRKQERERCAKVCESEKDPWAAVGYQSGVLDCVKAIRAME